MSDKTNKNQLSDRELKVLAVAWQCLKTDPQVDMQKFFKPAGYGSVQSAQVCWGRLKTKLLAYAADVEGLGPGSKPATTSIKSGRKASVATHADDEVSPAKKVKTAPERKTKAQAAAVVKEEVDKSLTVVKGELVEDGDEVPLGMAADEA
ncbi:hypothetical protein BJ170DRAFT_714536 [Xylariales sp. AK1849]|nr:hypothetical protein BJ170DRAFT_714536 [Xylariales sp. AK1849]